jgi:membrane-bound lytic murein transglycosylase D
MEGVAESYVSRGLSWVNARTLSETGGAGWRISIRRAAWPVALFVAALGAGGCATTAHVLKDRFDYRPAIANAFSHAIAIAPFSRKNASLKKEQFPPIPREENTPRVRAFIRKYAYDQRDTTRAYLATLEPYLPMLKKEARDNGLPEEISYLVMLESGADPEARSPANALGMWQFMPATARSYGLRVDKWVDERLDPQKSTRAAMRYLKDLYGQFGCWRLAISAYNSGENKLNKVLRQEDAEEYYEISSSPRLKRETKEFFPKFLALATIAKNPAKYGFPPLAEYKPDEKWEQISIRGAYRLETLARAAGVRHEELAQLNPALIRGITPADGPPYSLRVPLGKRTILLSNLDKTPEETGATHVTHVVTRGENLLKILRKYRVSKAQLVKANPDLNLNRRLRQGIKIVVPLEKGVKKSPVRTSSLSKTL